MINPISFLWKQFNGPQITAICQALWEYFHDTYDSFLEYFNKLSISTANSDHLTWLGILQGLSRPLIPIPDEDMFWFTEEHGYIDDPDNPGHLIPDAEFPSTHGFATEDGFPYGDFARLDSEKFTSGYHYIPDYLFRAVLRGNSSSKGYLGSLIALDDIMYSIWRIEHPTVPPVYEFSWGLGANNTTPGDIYLDMKVTGDWAYPYETQAEVRLLGSSVYYPIPRLYPILHEGDSTIDPYGFIRILLHTEEDEEGNLIYGLDSMWAGEGTPSDYVANGQDPEFDVSPITQAEENLMWQQDNTWIDEEAPGIEFVSLSLDEISDMWN